MSECSLGTAAHGASSDRVHTVVAPSAATGLHHATVVLLTVAHLVVVALLIESRPAVRPAAATIVALLAAVPVCAAISRIDLVELRIPNPLVGTLSLVAAGVVIVTPDRSVATVAGCLLAGLPLLAVRLHRGLGMGDVKFGAALGALAGLIHPVLAPLLVVLAAFTAGLAGTVLGRQRLALAPWLWGGLVVVLGLAPPLVGLTTGGLR